MDSLEEFSGPCQTKLPMGFMRKFKDFFFVEETKEGENREVSLASLLEDAAPAGQEVSHGKGQRPGGSSPGERAAGSPGETRLLASSSLEGALNPQEIFAAAGIPPILFTAEKAASLLESLPKDLSLETKREVVNRTLESAGVNLRDLLKDASQKDKALDDFLEQGAKALEEEEEKTRKGIEDLNRQISQIQQSLEGKKKSREKLIQHCQELSKEYEQVVAFFAQEKGKIN